MTSAAVTGRTAWFALGSNVDNALGDRVAHLCFARDELMALAHGSGQRVAISPLFETAPVGPAQPHYLNAVLSVTSELSPSELLVHAHRIEHARGRQRTVHWGPRTLDVDLLMVDDVTCDETLPNSTHTLVLPHPRIAERVFVLTPWSTLAPSWRLANGKTVWQQLQLLLAQEPSPLQPMIYVDSRWAGAASGTINNLR